MYEQLELNLFPDELGPSDGATAWWARRLLATGLSDELEVVLVRGEYRYQTNTGKIAENYLGDKFVIVTNGKQLKGQKTRHVFYLSKKEERELLRTGTTMTTVILTNYTIYDLLAKKIEPIKKMLDLEIKSA